MTIDRSDIPLASAERLAASTRNPDEIERSRAAAYHQKGIAVIDLNETLPFELRSVVTWWADRRWGMRRKGKTE